MRSAEPASAQFRGKQARYASHEFQKAEHFDVIWRTVGPRQPNFKKNRKTEEPKVPYAQGTNPQAHVRDIFVY